MIKGIMKGYIKYQSNKLLNRPTSENAIPVRDWSNGVVMLQWLRHHQKRTLRRRCHSSQTVEPPRHQNNDRPRFSRCHDDLAPTYRRNIQADTAADFGFSSSGCFCSCPKSVWSTIKRLGLQTDYGGISGNCWSGIVV